MSEEQCSSAKRARAPNFTSREKQVLFSILNKYKAIIENKKTDAVTNADKVEAWQTICHEFNAASPNYCHREVKTLMKVFKNSKTELRKIVALERKNTFGTGGGPQETIKPDELLLGIVNEKSVFGLHNPFDNDNLGEQATTSGASATIRRPSTPDVPQLERVVETTEDVVDPSSTKSELENVTFLKKPATILSTPKSTPLIKTKLASTSRRRPNIGVSALTSSMLGEKYTLVDMRKCNAEAEAKIQQLKLEVLQEKKKLLLEQQQQGREFHKIKMQKEKLELDLFELEVAKKI